MAEQGDTDVRRINVRHDGVMKPTNTYVFTFNSPILPTAVILIENFITKNDICIMNDKSYTYHSPSTKSFTSIDLSFCHPSLFLDYNWSVCEDQHNSDHFPIIIEQNIFSTEDHNPKWKLNRANWDLFNTLCTDKLVPENFKESSDPITDFTSSLIEISKECIPQTSTNPTKSNQWYNDDCKEAIKQRKQALSKFKRSPNTNNFNDIKVFRAKAHRTIKLSKRKEILCFENQS